jgi:hypothetical protein
MPVRGLVGCTAGVDFRDAERRYQQDLLVRVPDRSG